MTHDFITGMVAVNETTNVYRVSSWWQIIWWKICDCVRIHILCLFGFSVDCKTIKQFRDYRVKYQIAILVNIQKLKYV